MRFSEKEYARVREANADREELQEAQEEIARLRTALAEAQRENEELREDLVWAMDGDNDPARGNRKLFFRQKLFFRGSAIAFDGTDADLCRAIRETRRGE